jgi:hypothetical protein
MINSKRCASAQAGGRAGAGIASPRRSGKTACCAGSAVEPGGRLAGVPLDVATDRVLHLALQGPLC